MNKEERREAEKRRNMLIGNLNTLHNILGEYWKERISCIGSDLYELELLIQEDNYDYNKLCSHLDFLELQVLNIISEYKFRVKHFIQKEGVK